MLVRKFFLALAAFAFFSLYLFLIYSVLVPFFAPLAWATIIAIATFPLYRRLRARLSGRDNLAAALMTPAVVLLLAIPLLTILFFLVREIDNLLDLIQIRTATGDFPTQEGMGELPIFSYLFEYLKPLLEDLGIGIQETIAPALQNLVSGVVEKSKDLLKITVSLILGFFILAVSLFFFYRDGEQMIELFWSIIPLQQEQKILLGQKLGIILFAILYGVFLTAGIQGILGFVGYFLAGLPSPVLLGVLTIIAALVPFVGTALIWAPGSIYLLLSGKILPGLFLLAWGSIVVATTDNFIRPFFISGRGHLPFLTVLLGILGGLAAFGFIGIVLGPIILTLFFTIIGIYRDLLPKEAASSADNPVEPAGRP